MWAQIDVERAQEELRSLFAHQSSSGQLPQIVLWDRELVSRRSWHHVEAQGRLDWLLGRKPWTSVQIQPPVIAQAVEAIVDAGAAELLTEALPALERHYRFLAEHRDPDGDGLISIISQYESGLDFSPVFDAAPGEGPPVPVPSYLRARLTQLRNKVLGYDHPGRVFRWSPRHYEDVLVNAIYADGLDALARLAARVGSHTLEAWARDQAATVLAALVERCYDERRGFFFNLAGRGEHRIDGVLTVGGLVPLVLAGLPEEPAGRLAEHLADPRRFLDRVPGSVGRRGRAELRPGFPAERPPAHLARPVLDEHELAARPRAAAPRPRRPRGGALPAQQRARPDRRLQRVLRPAVGSSCRRGCLRLGDARGCALTARRTRIETGVRATRWIGCSRWHPCTRR